MKTWEQFLQSKSQTTNENIFGSIKKMLGMGVPPDVQKVFDEMNASQEEIESMTKAIPVWKKQGIDVAAKVREEIGVMRQQRSSDYQQRAAETDAIRGTGKTQGGQALSRDDAGWIYQN